ncbi:hypothetical protein F4703DRAFT_1844466 [Phycomyces blakesleeanus]
MVLKNKTPYKENAPLPKGVQVSFFGKAIKNESIEQPDNRSHWRLPEDEHEPSFYDEFDSLWHKRSSSEFVEQVSKRINEAEYGPNYSRMLESALGHAAFQLRDPYLAVAIFEQVKNHSVESYVSGCTVDVYNQMLNIRWRLWRDVHGIIGLVEEMNVNGVGYNSATREMGKSIAKEVLGEMRLEGQKDSEKSLWSADEKRATNLIKALVGKWLLK